MKVVRILLLLLLALSCCYDALLPIKRGGTTGSSRDRGRFVLICLKGGLGVPLTMTRIALLALNYDLGT
jgi:hypothetical protein